MLKKIVSFCLGLVFITQSTNAQVGLRFELGAGPLFGWVHDNSGFDPGHPYSTDLIKKGVGGNGMFAVLAEIPLSSAHPFILETGLGIGITDAAFEDGSGQKHGETQTFLRLPVKFDYRMALGKRSSLTFGVGPYASMYMGGCEYRGDNHVQVGLTPSVVFRYRKIHIGVNYYNPIIYNGPKDLNKNALIVTCGLTFNINPHWGGWKAIGTGMAVASAAAGSIATGAANTESVSPGESYVRNSPGAKETTNADRRNKDDKYTANDAMNASNNMRVYSNYVSQVSSMKVFGPVDMSQLRKIQKEMKKIREKNNKNPNNPHISKNELEDWDGKLK